MKAKKRFLLRISVICIGFYIIWYLVSFLSSGEYFTTFNVFMMIILLIFPCIFGIYSYIKNKSVIITTIIYFILTFIFFTIFFIYMNSLDISKITWESFLDGFFLPLILTLECFVAAMITKIIIKIKRRNKERGK